MSLIIRALLFVLLDAIATVRSQSLSNSFFVEPDTNAGFYTHVNQKGLDLLADFLGDRTARFLKHGELPINLTGPLTNETVAGFFRAWSPMDGQFSTRCQTSLIQGKNFNATVETAYRISSAVGHLAGTVPMRVESNAIELELATGVNNDGHLKTDLIDCTVIARNVALNFTPADIEVLRNYIPHIVHFVMQRMDQALCPSFKSELVPVISNRLLNTPMSAALFDHFFINYGLIEPVRYMNSSVQLKHRGNSFGVLRQGRNRLNDFRLPFRSPPLNPSLNSSRMVDFYMSNYTLASLFFWMDQYRLFDYEISSETMANNTGAGSGISEYLRTECGSEEICAGSLFPALAQRFPRGMVQIKTHTVTFPHVMMEAGKATIGIESRIDAFVQQNERTRRFLTAGMHADLTLKAMKFKQYALTGSMKIEGFKIRDVVSLVDGITATSMEFLVGALNELIIGDDIAKKLKDGIKLPIVFDFEMLAADVVFEKERLRVSADFCFEEKCKTPVGENRDNDLDYYDILDATKQQTKTRTNKTKQPPSVRN